MMIDKIRQNPGAAALIAVGALLLMFQVFDISIWSLIGDLWFLFVLIPGLAFLWVAYNGGEKASGLAFPGMIVTGTGAILAYQSLTNHWESWAYIWTLYPAFVGLAMIFNARRSRNSQDLKTGSEMVRWSVIAFVGSMIVFEMFIFGGNFSLTRFLIPASLAAGGAYLLFNNKNGEKPKRNTIDAVPAPPRKIKNSDGSINAAEINPELRRKIDEALREDMV